MSILDRRAKVADAVIKDRFIRQQLDEESKEIDKAQDSLIVRRGFRSNEWGKRSFAVGNNQLTYTHLPRHRFVDMRTRQTDKGKIQKKFHPIHNRILFGHFNNIIKRLHFGFTTAVREELARDLDQSK